MEKEFVQCWECVHRDKNSCPLFYAEIDGLRFFTPYAKKDDFSCKVGERKCQP